MVSERRWLTWIFILYFLLGSGYSLLMPIWEAPDEPAHYHLAWQAARLGEYAVREINYEAHQPRAFYYLGSYVIRALDSVNPRLSDFFYPREYKFNIRVRERRFEWNDYNYRFLLGVYALRWLNLLLGALALRLNWQAFKIVAPDEPTLQLSALALAALTPQYLHIMSSVNNDALGTLAGALLFYLGARALRDPGSRIKILLIPLAVLLPFTTKLTVLPVSAALLGIAAWQWFFGLRQKKWALVSALVLAFGAGALYVLFPEMIHTSLGEIAWRLSSLRKRGVDLEYLITIATQIVWTYWGMVGWIAVGLSWWVVALLSAFGLVGIVIKISAPIESSASRPQFDLWVTTSLIAMFTVFVVARNGLTTGATQGRLLFPAIGALSLLMVGGWHEALSERAQRTMPLTIVVLMVLLNIGLWAFGIVPVYYQPFLD